LFGGEGDMFDDDLSMVIRLFAQEIPEIAAGKVQIKAIARRPGYRTKLALHSLGPHVDCVGVCVGVRGCHIKKIVDGLGGERLDLFRWHESPEQLIANALQPARIERVVLRPAEHRAVVVVKPEQVSLVLGPRGDNRQLASQLSGWQIDIQEA
jgi:N utilization substance protein A